MKCISRRTHYGYERRDVAERPHIDDLKGRVVALKLYTRTVIGRLGLQAHNGKISWCVSGVLFVDAAVQHIVNSAILPMVVLG